jgi:hypothetical protein
MKALSLRWWSVIWRVNVFFLVMTVIFAHLPDGSTSLRHRLIQYLAQFTLAKEIYCSPLRHSASEQSTLLLTRKEVSYAPTEMGC